MEQVNHPALTMWEITQPSPEAQAVDAAAGVTPVAVVTAPTSAPAPVAASAAPVEVAPAPVAAAVAPAPLPSPVQLGEPTGGLGYVISVLDKVRAAGLSQPMGTTPEAQMAALQMSTAVNLLTAGANMLLMYSGALGTTPAAMMPIAAPIHEGPAAEAAPVAVAVADPVHEAAGDSRAPVASASIVLPATFTVPGEKVAEPIRTVTLGGSGSRSAVTIGGAAALPFRHFEGNVGHAPVIAMEVFDKVPRHYPATLRERLGALVDDPAAFARHCVEALGAEVISVRLDGAHPDNGDASPDAAAEVIGRVLAAVKVPLIVTGPSHFEKNNAVMKQIAGQFAGENLLLNWAETDNYKTLAAAAMGYGHCLVCQSPIDVNMAKQLSILTTNMGLPADKIVIDAMTGAIGYGLEYTYSVMERIRTAAFTGDTMLAMPILGTPGYEVAKTKECKAPASAFPIWGPEAERGALLEIATAMSLLNAGADLLIMYHPTAVTAVKRKIAEMMMVDV
jgi:acetyl-CoA decarbonylase/synthase complex subunit delta